MLAYLIAYDLDDDPLRDAVAKRILRHGERVQESVFEVWFHSPRGMPALLRELRTLLPAHANVRWYRLTEAGLADSGSHSGTAPRKPPVAVIA